MLVVKNCRPLRPPERPLCGHDQRKKTKREGDTGKGKDRPEGLRSFRQRPVNF